MIKNIQKFLAVAAISTCAVSVDVNAAGPGYQRTSEFQGLDPATIASMPVFKVANLSGERVRFLPGEYYPSDTVKRLNPSNADHFALVNHLMGYRSCSVFVDTEPVKDFAFRLVDKSAYYYSVLAHEMSHCVGITPEEAGRIEAGIIQNHPSLKNYGQMVTNLSGALQEVHADTMAALLGASKTGDWSVFEHNIVPEKTESFDPAHASLLASWRLLDDIDPRKVKGMSYDEIAKTANGLFTRNVYGKNGDVKLDSPVVTSILQEWYITGLETKTYMLAYGKGTKDANLVVEWTQLHRQFGELAIGKQPLKDKDTINQFFGMRAYALASQNEKIESSSTLRRNEEALRNHRLNENRIKNIAYIVKNADHLHYGKAKNSFDSYQKQFKKTLDKYSNPMASQILYESISTVMADALLPIGPNAQQIQKAESNVRKRFSQIIHAPSTAPDLSQLQRPQIAEATQQRRFDKDYELNI